MQAKWAKYTEKLTKKLAGKEAKKAKKEVKQAKKLAKQGYRYGDPQHSARYSRESYGVRLCEADELTVDLIHLAPTVQLRTG